MARLDVEYDPQHPPYVTTDVTTLTIRQKPENMQRTPVKDDKPQHSTVSGIGPTPKRSSSELSPDGQVGSMPTKDLLVLMNQSISLLLDEKLKNLPTKDDLLEIKESVSHINQEVVKLTDENKALKVEIQQLKEHREQDMVKMRRIEEDLCRKKILIRGLNINKSPYNAAIKFLREDLKMEKDVSIERAIKLNERNGKMMILVEFTSAIMVSEVFKHTQHLVGTSVYVERDLCSERLQDKGVMLQLKKDILTLDKSKRILVKNDKLVIDGKLFFWNRNKELMCQKSTGLETLVNIYGNSLKDICVDFKYLLDKIQSKN